MPAATCGQSGWIRGGALAQRACTTTSPPPGPFYGQPIVLDERQAGMAVEGVEQHNRAKDQIRISTVAIDADGVTNVATAIAKLLGFDRCPLPAAARSARAKAVGAHGLVGASEPGGCHLASPSSTRGARFRPQIGLAPQSNQQLTG